MIDPAAWYLIWGRLCRRFNREVNPEEAGDYLAYLEKAGMNTASVTAAAEAVWATREFFPKPADFLSGEATIGWRAIQEWGRDYHREIGGAGADALMARIPARAKEAINAIGGLHLVKTIDPAKMPMLRKQYMEAFASVVVEESVAPRQLTVAGFTLVADPTMPEGQVELRTKVEAGIQRLRVDVGQQ